MNEKLSELYDFTGILLDIGEKLLICGAEVYRAEETLAKMIKAYGAEKQSVFVITSNIIISIDMPGGMHVTDTRRVLKAGSTNYSCLEALNSLSRSYCEKTFPVSELRERVDACTAQVSSVYTVIGSFIAAGAAAVFFGGSYFDGIVAAFLSLIVCHFQISAARVPKNRFQLNFAASLTMGIAAVILTRIIPYTSADNVIIGNITLLIPGFAMTSSIRDIIVGDTISGSMRFIETLIWSAGLAIGIMLSLWGGALW